MFRPFGFHFGSFYRGPFSMMGGWRGPWGWYRPSKEEWLKMLNEYKEDLQKELAEIEKEIARVEKEK